MSINSVMSSGAQGVQLGIERANQAGGRIARAGAESDGADLVGMKQSQFQVEAAAKVVKAGDSMLGSIIDIQA